MATIVKDLGAVTAYAYAKEKGYTGTEDEFSELMASYADVAEQAAESAEQAGASATAAEQAKVDAALSASAAASSASTASTKASEAASSASSAAGSANTATTKASEASASATSAASSASAAATSATNAGASETAAASSATAASNAQTAAETAQGKAEDAQTAAEDAAEQAGIYAAGYLKAFATDTASGPIVSFPDGADGIPMKDIVCEINPAQDLHGYDAPWPAGGGKNLVETTGTTQTINGVTFTVNSDGTINVSGTASAAITFVVHGYQLLSDYGIESGTTYILSGTPSGLSGKAYVMLAVNGSGSEWRDTEGSGATFTPTDVTKQYRAIIIVQNGVMVSETFKPMICLSTATDPTVFAPYSNICPITGWTGANVTRTGKNLLDTKNFAPTSSSSGGITTVQNQDGTFAASGTASGVVNLWLRGNYGASNPVLKLYAGKQYIIKDVMLYRGTTQVTPTCYIGSAVTYSPQSDVLITGVRASTPIGTTLDTTIYPYITDSGDSAWQEFGDTYSITFPSEAGTVYGGTLDVTTGKLTVDRAMVDLGTLTWVKRNTSSGHFRFTAELDIYRPGSTTVVPNVICSIYPTITPADSWIGVTGVSCNTGASQALISDETYTDAATFKAAMSGVQLCYELATPVEYTLDPVTVTTLLAQNNIFADCGDSTVEYRADPTLYINKKIAALAAAMN